MGNKFCTMLILPLSTKRLNVTTSARISWLVSLKTSVMTRFPIEPHFVYSQGYDTTTFPSWNEYNQYMGHANGNLYNMDSFTGRVFKPQINLPALGNTHTHRRGNRITVTSIRTKIHINLDPRWCSIYRDTSVPIGQQFENMYQNAPAVKRFFKCRFMVVQFNDELEITETELGKWFHATYCYFMNPAYNPPAPADNYLNYPISVHSNILRLTTPYTGKFNILMDKPFTLVSTRPQQLIDVNIPLNKSYVFDEDDPTKLLFPNIWMFILPPLNVLTDMDPLTSIQLRNWYNKETVDDNDKINVFPFIQIYWFAKLNFVDL